MQLTKKNRAFHLVIQVCHDHKDLLESKLRATGLYSTNHRMLMFISKNKSCSQKEIAEDFKVSTATVAVNLKKMDNAGLIERKPLEDDNRYNVLEITPKGQKIIDKSEEIFKSIDDKMFEDFTDEDLEIFTGYLERIESNLNSYDK